MKTTKKNRKYVYVNGIRYIKKSGLLILDQIISDTFDNFHNYLNKQTF